MRSRRACCCSLAVLALLASGCVRAGFGASGGDGAGADRGRAERSVIGELGGASLDRDNDTCATALTVDVNAALATPLTIALDFTGAKNDHGVPACKGYPELVLRLVNVTALGMLTKSCSGGGQLLDFAPASGCPLDDATGGSSSIVSCSPGNFQSLLVSEGGGYLLLCRDPASPPKLTLTLALGSS